MASIKVKFRPSTIEGHEGAIYYQIIHRRKPRQILSDYHILSEEWDEKYSGVSASGKGNRKVVLNSISQGIRQDLERLTRIINSLGRKNPDYTADDVVEEYKHFTRNYTLFVYMQRLIKRLKHNGKIRTSETYTATLNSFRKFRNNQDIMLDSINSDVMESYEAWHKGKGHTPNTISFYFRILRAVYNRAVEEEIIENRNPFRRVYTGVDKTLKRALPLSDIKKIKALDLSLHPMLDHARDMFLLSFMLRGMSFIDMAFLRKSDLINGKIVYRRRKTGQQLVIEWTKEMQLILDKYPQNSTCYLLPIILNPGTNERYAYKNAGAKINRNLKKVAFMAGITMPLSLYVARHSWASIAQSRGVPVALISAGMGHDSESTTQIYLASLDTKAVDRMNSMLINLL